jgi:hypothetical protein
MYPVQRGHRGRAGLPAAGLALLAVLGGFLAAQPARAVSVRQAAAAAAPGTRQLITVTAASHSATRAALRAYRVSGGKRTLLYGLWTARVGYHGIARPGAKREGADGLELARTAD